MMDPDIVWKNIQERMQELCRGDETVREDLVEDLYNLADWLNRNGYPPEHEYVR